MALAALLPLALQFPPQLSDYEFGDQDQGLFADALAAAGDWDGDGVADYAIGAPGADVQALFALYPEHGRVEVRSGADDSAVATTADVYATGGVRLGDELAGGFDSDADGLLEIAAWASQRNEVVILERFSAGSSALVPIATLTATDSASLFESDFGRVLENVGDLTGDGVDDLAIGSPSADRLFFGTVQAENVGSVRLVSGATWTEVDTWSIGGQDSYFGSAIDDVRDVNGNGTRDLAIGAPGTALGSTPGPGRVLFVDTGIVFPSPVVQTLQPANAEAGFGAGLLEVGDITGGTKSELLVGTYGFEALEFDPFTPLGAGFLPIVERGSLTLYEGDTFQPLWTRGGTADGILLDPRGLARGDFDGDLASEIAVVELADATNGAAVLALSLLDGATERRFDATAGLGSYSRADLLFGSSDAGGRVDLLFGTPALEFGRGGLFRLRVPQFVPPSSPTTWTVDAAGGADFVGLSQAAMVARAGDRIEVAPGDYSAFGIGKAVDLIGSDTGQVSCPAFDLLGASSGRVERLVTSRWRIGGVPGRLTIEGGRAGAMQVTDAGDLTLIDVELGPAATSDAPGLEVTGGSRVELLNASLEGASPPTLGGSPGLAALRVGTGSRVTAIESTFRGADAEVVGPFMAENPPGPAIEIAGGDVDLRGGLTSAVQGGLDPDDPSQNAADVLLDPTAGGLLELSATFPALDVEDTGAGVVLTKSLLAPWIDYASNAPIGGTWTVEMHGEAGRPGALFQSLGAANTPLTGVIGQVWVDPGQAFLIDPFVGSGLGISTIFVHPVAPVPALAGLEFHVQGFVLNDSTVAGNVFDATNGGAVELRL